MPRYAAVTDFHITVYLFTKAPKGKPVIDDGVQIDKIEFPPGFVRDFRAYESLLGRHGWTPAGSWGFAIARARNSEQPCILVS